MPTLLNKPISEDYLAVDFSTSSCIHEKLSCIEDNSRKISSLTKKKQKNTEKISATLDFLRLSKKYLSTTQIESFVKFSAISEASSHTLRGITKQLDTLESTAKDTLLHTDTATSLVHNKLNAVISLQQFALSCLENIISLGDTLLQNLERIQ